MAQDELQLLGCGGVRVPHQRRGREAQERGQEGDQKGGASSEGGDAPAQMAVEGGEEGGLVLLRGGRRCVHLEALFSWMVRNCGPEHHPVERSRCKILSGSDRAYCWSSLPGH